VQSLLNRAITAASYALGKGRNGQAPQSTPDIFAGTVPLCGDIGHAADAILIAAINLRASRSVNDLDGMKTAAAELAERAAWLTSKTESLAQVLRWHDDYLRREAAIEPATEWACIACNQMNDKAFASCCRCGRHR
jgi:hypothetical protein